MAGKFTTVEGILADVKAELQKSNPFIGDSATNSKLTAFLEKLSEVYTDTSYIMSVHMHSFLDHRWQDAGCGHCTG